MMQVVTHSSAMQVFVLSQRNVKEKGYVTLFQYMTKNKKSAFARVVMSAPEVLQARQFVTLLGDAVSLHPWRIHMTCTAR